MVAVVLAAGRASRFGAAKQVAELDGSPLVLHAVRAAQHPAVSRVGVVVGAHAGEVRAALEGSEVTVVAATNWADGLAASLKAGLRYAGPDASVLVLLADMPEVTRATVDRILAHRHEDVDAVRATFGGRAAHPVLLHPRLLPALEALAGDRGAAGVLAEADVVLVACDDVGSDRDVDTPTDLRAMSQRRR